MVCTLLASVSDLPATTCIFQSSGNWSETAKWQNSLKPGTGDSVVINADCTVKSRTNSATNVLTANTLTQSCDLTGIAYNFNFLSVVNAKALLQGPYNATAGTMNTTLKFRNLLPHAQPYGASPWNYSGTENVSAFLDSGIVDWVLVELRAASPNGSVVARRAGFVLADGTLTDLDGASPIALNIIPGSYYLVVRHRNHLAIVCRTPSPFRWQARCTISRRRSRKRMAWRRWRRSTTVRRHTACGRGMRTQTGS